MDWIMMTKTSCIQELRLHFEVASNISEITREQVVCFWPAIPTGINAVDIVAISKIVARCCGPDAATVYLIEAAHAFTILPV